MVHAALAKHTGVTWQELSLRRTLQLLGDPHMVTLWVSAAPKELGQSLFTSVVKAPSLGEQG